MVWESTKNIGDFAPKGDINHELDPSSHLVAGASLYLSRTVCCQQHEQNMIDVLIDEILVILCVKNHYTQYMRIIDGLFVYSLTM